MGLTPAPQSNSQFGVSGELITFNSYSNAIGSPGSLSWYDPSSPHTDIWDFTAFVLPEGYPQQDFTGTGGNLSSLGSDIAGLTTNKVVTFLDIDSVNQAYGMTWASTSLNIHFTAVQGTVATTGMQAAASAAGEQGQVITALSFFAGQIYYVAYGLDVAPSSQFDVQVAPATLDSLGSTATALASAGYLITAAGGNYTDGFLLIGTKLQGDSTARPISLVQGLPISLSRGNSTVFWVNVNGQPFLCVGQQ